jgi:transaldolase
MRITTGVLGSNIVVTLKDLRVKLFTDGADKAQIREMAKRSWIRGFTTNPSLMKAAHVPTTFRTPTLSLRCRTGTFLRGIFRRYSGNGGASARHQLLGANVYAKLPVTTTRGEPLFNTVRALSNDGIKVNLTGVFAAEQAAAGVEAVAGGAAACVSVFPAVLPTPVSIIRRSFATRSRGHQ